jgi:hypothetical protein
MGVNEGAAASGTRGCRTTGGPGEGRRSEAVIVVVIAVAIVVVEDRSTAVESVSRSIRLGVGSSSELVLHEGASARRDCV